MAFDTADGVQMALHLTGTRFGDRSLIVTKLTGAAAAAAVAAAAAGAGARSADEGVTSRPPAPRPVRPVAGDSNPAHKTVYMSNVSLKAGIRGIADFFAGCGTVLQVKDLKQTRDAKFVKVEFSASREADAAAALDGTLLLDRPLRISKSMNLILGYGPGAAAAAAATAALAAASPALLGPSFPASQEAPGGPESRRPSGSASSSPAPPDRSRRGGSGDRDWEERRPLREHHREEGRSREEDARPASRDRSRSPRGGREYARHRPRSRSRSRSRGRSSLPCSSVLAQDLRRAMAHPVRGCGTRPTRSPNGRSPARTSEGGGGGGGGLAPLPVEAQLAGP